MGAAQVEDAPWAASATAGVWAGDVNAACARRTGIVTRAVAERDKTGARSLSVRNDRRPGWRARDNKEGATAVKVDRRAAAIGGVDAAPYADRPARG